MTKYFIGANWDDDANWSSTSGGANDTTKPTAADDVRLDANSGNCTINGTPVCRSIDCNGYASTLTHNSGITLTIGDGTAGAGNIALRFVAGMTYTLGSATTSAINFISTSATVQTVDFASKTTGNVTYNATSNGSWQLTGTHNTGTGATVTLTKGTLDTNGQTVSWGTFNSSNSNVRTLTLGASSITLTGGGNAWNTTTTSNYTLNANTSTITLTGAASNFVGGVGKTYNNVVLSGTGNCGIDNSTFANVTRTGNANKTDRFSLIGSITVTGTITINGNSATNRIWVTSNGVGAARTITAANVSVTNADFQDITGAGAGSWNLSGITGGSGDCGGNSGITFTTAATQTWNGTSGGNWSANAWTSRVPLPQDDVVINAAFSASQTVTADMPRLGKSIDWTGATGSPTWSFGSTTNTIYGGVTLISGMTISGTNTTTFSGRSSFNLTSAGKQFSQAITIDALSGTITLQDDFSTAGALSLTRGTFTANDFDVTCATFDSSNSNTRTLNMGSGTWSLTSTAATTVWNVGTVTGLTFSGASATITIVNASTNQRQMNLGYSGAALTYGTIDYTVAGSTGALKFDNDGSAPTVTTFNFSDASNARSLIFNDLGTGIIFGTFNVQGTAGKLMTIQTTVASNHKINSPNDQICNYLSISRSTAAGGGTWYAGADSTDGGNNSGWLFVSPADDERSGKLTGTDTTSSERDAKITGTDTSNSERDAKLTGQDSANSERSATMTGTATTNDERSSKITGQDTSSSERAAKITGVADTANDEREAKLTGADTSNSERSSKLTGTDTTNNERSAKITGQESTSSERPAKITGQDSSSSERSAKITGQDSAISERASKITGQDSANAERPAKLTGTDTSTSERQSKITGTDTTSSERQSKVTGQQSTNDERSAKITGSTSSNDERAARITGTDTATSERDAKITGTAQDSSERSSKITGQDLESSERQAKIHGTDTISSERSTKIAGMLAATSERGATLTGIAAPAKSINLGIRSLKMNLSIRKLENSVAISKT